MIKHDTHKYHRCCELSAYGPFKASRLTDNQRKTDEQKSKRAYIYTTRSRTRTEPKWIFFKMLLWLSTWTVISKRGLHMSLLQQNPRAQAPCMRKCSDRGCPRPREKSKSEINLWQVCVWRNVHFKKRLLNLYNDIHVWVACWNKVLNVQQKRCALNVFLWIVFINVHHNIHSMFEALRSQYTEHLLPMICLQSLVSTPPTLKVVVALLLVWY